MYILLGDTCIAWVKITLSLCIHTIAHSMLPNWITSYYHIVLNNETIGHSPPSPSLPPFLPISKKSALLY